MNHLIQRLPSQRLVCMLVLSCAPGGEQSNSPCTCPLPGPTHVEDGEQNAGTTEWLMAFMPAYPFLVNGLSETRVVLNFHFGIF